MGRRAKDQRKYREQLARWIAKKVAKRIAETDQDESRLLGTNRLLPPGGLRRRCVRNIFGGWAMKFQGGGRCFTKPLALRCCVLLRDRFGLENPPPAEEVARMHELMKLARKHKCRRPKAAMPPANPDEVETQPLMFEASASNECLNFIALACISLMSSKFHIYFTYVSL